jgi:hypothetical protein
MGFDLSAYETVEDRLARFWADHPSARIETAMMNYDGDTCIFRAEIFFDCAQTAPTATGYAEEVKGSSPVNRTSFVENCETSAIGRALANCGYATHGKRPSREEMAKVSRAGAPNLASSPSSAQTPITTIGGQQLRTEKQAGYAKALGKKAGFEGQAYDEWVIGLIETPPEVMTIAQANQVIDTLKGMSA